eukprot:1161646-Pelagomonas_calceolata.AAC.22
MKGIPLRSTCEQLLQIVRQFEARSRYCLRIQGWEALEPGAPRNQEHHRSPLVSSNLYLCDGRGLGAYTVLS